MLALLIRIAVTRVTIKAVIRNENNKNRSNVLNLSVNETIPNQRQWTRQLFVNYIWHVWLHCIIIRFSDVNICYDFQILYCMFFFIFSVLLLCFCVILHGNWFCIVKEVNLVISTCSMCSGKIPEHRNEWNV